MTRVLIVSRTRLGAFHCIGGVTRDDLRDVRLCLGDGNHGNPPDAPYQIGDVWDLDLRPATRIEAPHVEDVVVTGGRRVATQSGLGKYLATRVQVWSGGPGSMFGGLLEMKPSGSAYVPVGGGLMQSVGFWRPDADLAKGQSEAVRYEYGGLPSLSVRYVGVSEPVERIPAGALVRVSLSRAFAPSGGPNANWLQLSGWYPE